MLADLFPTDGLAFVSSVKSCVKLKDTVRLQFLLTVATESGLLQRNVYVGNAFVDTYATCGDMAKAEEVLDMLPNRNVVSWSSLIARYVQQGFGETAVSCYEKMILDGVCPNAHTFSCVFKACASIQAIHKGIQLHSVVEHMECVRSSSYVCTALMNMYEKCGMKARARDVFSNNPVHDVVAWTSFVASYIAEGQGEKALHCFRRMELVGCHPNAISFTCLLGACSSTNATMEGIELHADIERKGLLEGNLILGSALVNLYVKCGLLDKAQEVFDGLPFRDDVVWTTLMVGYEGSTSPEHALESFNQMQVEGFVPDPGLFTCSLKACGYAAASNMGKEIHAKIAAYRLSETSVSVGCALIGMYAKCGLLSKAREAFDAIPTHNRVHWTSLITHYAQLEKVDDVIRLFDRMIGEGIKPEFATLLCVLNACGLSSLAENSKTYFEAMSAVLGVVPTLKHRLCMLDCRVRAGQLEETSSVAKWEELELEGSASGQSLQVNNEVAASFVCAGSILADAQMQGKETKGLLRRSFGKGLLWLTHQCKKLAGLRLS